MGAPQTGQRGGDAPVLLFLHHLPDGFLVIVGFAVAGDGALPQAIVPLGIEQAGLGKAGFLEAVVDVGGQDKIVFGLYQTEQIGIDRPGRVHIAVDEDKPAPVGPVFLPGFEGIEAPGIHVVEAAGLLKIGKIPFKPFPVIGQAGRSGQARARADDHGVGSRQLAFQPLHLIREAPDRGRNRRPGKH